MTTFAQLCGDAGADFQRLRQLVEQRAIHGAGYELPHCRLPAGCQPGEVTVGVCRRPGGYLLYWQPSVKYQGSSRVLAALFARGVWRFDTFQQLTSRLSSLRLEVARHTPITPQSTAVPPPSPSPRPAPPPAGEDAPELFLKLRRELERHVLGQAAAVEAAAFRLYSHVGKRSPNRPLSLILYGPTGVGKSELGKAIAPALSQCLGEPWKLIWTELNTFTQSHSVHRLTGAPPGYVGYEDSPILESVRAHPRAVFMFDELDKAHPDVLKIFLSILDEGRCSARRAGEDGDRELDFRRCVFVFTTNADLTKDGGRTVGFCAQREEEAPSPSQLSDVMGGLAERLYAENETARQAMVRHGVLKEIAGRFTGLIGFHPLDARARLAITVKQIAALGREYGVQLSQIDPETVQALAPTEGGLSIRSRVGVLEGLLTPLLIQAAHCQGVPFRLTGLPGGLRLLPLYDQITAASTR